MASNRLNRHNSAFGIYSDQLITTEHYYNQT